MTRHDQLRRFGPVPAWLDPFIEVWTARQWRLFFDGCDAAGRVPQSIDETMPRDSSGLVVSPAILEPGEQLHAVCAWREWEEIWGEAPWRHQKPKPRSTIAKSRAQTKFWADH